LRKQQSRERARKKKKKGTRVRYQRGNCESGKKRYGRGQMWGYTKVIGKGKGGRVRVDVGPRLRKRGNRKEKKNRRRTQDDLGGKAIPFGHGGF